MGLVTKSWSVGCALLGIAAFSQAPEFSQQYQQRLGGGIAELGTVIKQFDDDATREGLTREEALDALTSSNEDFPKRRGDSMAEAIDRFQSLLEQREAMEFASPLMQPVHLLRNPDTKILSGTYEDFKPGLKFTLEGLVWGLLGGTLIGGIARAPVSVARRRKKEKERAAIEAEVIRKLEEKNAHQKRQVKPSEEAAMISQIAGTPVSRQTDDTNGSR